jgi:UDP-glucose 4-epimerase
MKDGGERAMQVVLVTGGTGFIGRHVVAALAAAGYKCLVTTRTTVKSNHPSIEYMSCNLAAPESISQLRPFIDMADTVIHVAALIPPATPLHEEIVSYTISNVLATATLLEAVVKSLDQRKTEKPSLVFTSTLDVYGIPQRLPVQEEDPTEPHTIYAVTKLSAENLCRMFERACDIPVTILRLSHVYGPGEPVIKAIPQFIAKILQGESPVIYGDGEDARDYVYVSDVAEAVIKAAQRRLSGTFNISGGRGHTIREVAETIIQISGKKLQPIFKERRQAASKIVISNEKAREQLDWLPRTSLPEGLVQQYEYANYREEKH